MTDNQKRIQQWIKQADYDFETATAMFKTEKYIYSVFMCHLSAEKLLKGLYLKNLNTTPPKVHSLVYLVQIQKIELTEELRKILENLDEISVPTRYPDELDELLKVYNKKRTKDILKQTKEVILCLKQKFDKP